MVVVGIERVANASMPSSEAASKSNSAKTLPTMGRMIGDPENVAPFEGKRIWAEPVKLEIVGAVKAISWSG